MAKRRGAPSQGWKTFLRNHYLPPSIPFRAVKRVWTLGISVVARARGEQPPKVTDVMDHLLAPLYMRALFRRPASEAFAERLV